MDELLVKLLADGSIIVIALVATAALLLLVPNKQKFDAYARILMAGLTAYLVAKLVGSIYQPAMERPFELLGQVAGAAYLNNPGFPSDHVLFAMTLTLAVWFETRWHKLAIFLLSLTLLMGAGRVLALVHTPLDVLGGLLFASIGAVWYQWPQKRVVKKHHDTLSPKIQK